MESTALGAVAALAATTLFSAGLVLQAIETRRVDPRHSLHLSLIARLMASPRWLLGTSLTLLGFPLHVSALLLAPLTVVQPALSAGLILLLAVGARTPGENVGRQEVVGVVAIIAGVAGMTFSAPERGASLETGTGALVAALVALAAVTLVPYALARLREETDPSLATLATFAAGAAYAFTGITTKLVADGLGDDNWPAALGWSAATAAVGGLGFLGQLTALQRRSATQVGPVIYVVPVIVPVLLAPFVTAEDWGSTPLGGGALIAFLLVVCAGTALVSASSTVHRAMHAKVQAPAAAGEP
jgi:drug/metabolite transporter (DMT)-like permease